MTTGVMHVANFRQYRQQKYIDYDISTIYDFKKKIGYGSFGEVWETSRKEGNIPCAIKIISKQKLEENQIYLDLME